MIHYHGVVPQEKYGAILLRSRHVLIPFTTPKLATYAARVAQSFVLDNGAFSHWKRGKPITDWKPYYAWVREWMHHPGFDWAAIPDVIGGTEEQNRELVMDWFAEFNKEDCTGRVARYIGCPVWHLHESLDYLFFLAVNFRTVAIGSSGKFSEPGTKGWWHRMDEVMRKVCDEKGRPICKLHGMRMLDKDIFTRLPLASADSVNVALRVSRSTVSKRHMPPLHRAQLCIERIEPYNSLDVYKPQQHLTNHLFKDKTHEPSLRERPRV